ncbi:MAG TPA: hypothetical protein VNW68_06025, partial [Candidatus Limnocylindria bacterium]|nr:hypothetical protein [Candidatus Limnocylindria bacterium]
AGSACHFGGNLMIFGYVDPGSGSLIIQAVIAAMVAIPFFLRRQLARVVALVRRDDHEIRS